MSIRSYAYQWSKRDRGSTDSAHSTRTPLAVALGHAGTCHGRARTRRQCIQAMSRGHVTSALTTPTSAEDDVTGCGTHNGRVIVGHERHARINQCTCFRMHVPLLYRPRCGLHSHHPARHATSNLTAVYVYESLFNDGHAVIPPGRLAAAGLGVGRRRCSESDSYRGTVDG